MGAQLVQTRYGREQELESDEYGMKYMKQAGYDPAAAISLQETFVRLSEGRRPGWLEGLFASHPPSQERVETVKNRNFKSFSGFFARHKNGLVDQTEDFIRVID